MGCVRCVSLLCVVCGVLLCVLCTVRCVRSGMCCVRGTMCGVRCEVSFVRSPRAVCGVWCAGVWEGMSYIVIVILRIQQ